MKIYNPYKNTFEDLHSIQGMQLLKKYIKNYQNGGSGATATTITTLRPLPTTEAVGTTDIGSRGDGGGGGGGKPQEKLPKYGSCEGYNLPVQFNACIKDIVVVFLGGFHPFHRGHFLSYLQAKETFGEDVCFYVAASNSKPKQKTGNKNIEAVRPFPFEAKKQLAILSGVKEDEIICDMNPMVLNNIKNFIPDIENKHLIIVRSEKELEDELITNENAIEKMKDNILNLKINSKKKEGMTEQQLTEFEKKIMNYATGKFGKFRNDNNLTDNDPTFYKITGRGNNKEFKYDEYQPIPVECYETNEEGKKKFKFDPESINLLKPKEGQIGFVHITTTVPIEDGEMNLSSGTKIRRAYINARSEEEKTQILSILYPNKSPKEYKYISAIYDTYLNETFFENYKQKQRAKQSNAKSKAKSKGGGKK